MNFWDTKFNSDDYMYGKEPNRFLFEQALRLPPHSQVLVPGDGEGRNSVWLATQAHDVTALDSSAVGLDKARKLATDNNVVIQTKLADLETWEPKPSSYDAIVLTYVHLPPSWRSTAHQRLLKGLRPNGWVILEAFHPKQLAFSSGGPKDVAFLYTPQMMQTDMNSFAGIKMNELMAWEGEVSLSEGSGHQGPAYVTRYLAQRLAG